jgi:HlyD family secretion protein
VKKKSFFQKSQNQFSHWGFAVLILCLSVILLRCAKKEEDAKKDRPIVPIVEEVKYVDLKDVISNTGELKAVTKVDLKSEASGRIDKILVEEGAVLQKGQVILEIDPERLKTTEMKLNLNLRKSTITMETAKREYENAQKLAEFGKIADNKLEDLKNQYELSRIGFEELQLELKDLKKELDNTVIRSPLNGILVLLNVQEGEIVVSATSSNSGGTSIGVIANMKNLEVETEVGEIDYPKIQVGMPAYISMSSDPMRKTKGTIDFISKSAKKISNSTVSTFKILAAVDSLIEGMVPGVNVNIDLVLVDKKHVLGVPFTFVNEQKGKEKITYSVFIEGEEKARNIKVGLTDYKYYEVLEGLKEGEKAVKKPPEEAGKEKRNGGGRGAGAMGMRH